MTLEALRVAVEDNRVLLEAASIRGIDLDYLLDPRVDHASCLEAFNKMVAGEHFTRWCFILEEATPEHLQYLSVVHPKHPRVVAAKEARKALKTWFKGYVLCFFKDAERKSMEDNKKIKRPRDASGVPLKEGEDEQ